MSSDNKIRSILCLALLLCVAVSPSSASSSLSEVGSGPTNEALWIVVAGFSLAFALSFGVGANDVANVFGTSVGSKAISLRNACILATVFETLGAVLIGYKVSDTVRKGIMDVSLYNGTEKELMLGSLASLTASAAWNILATFLRLPVSGTHTIVGATIGFALLGRGISGVHWTTFGKIVLSWFISPLLSGAISASLFLGVRRFILRSRLPLQAALVSLPIFYGFTVLVNVFSIIHDGPQILYLNGIPWFVSLPIAAFVGAMVAVGVQCCLVPRQKEKIGELNKVEEYSVPNSSANGGGVVNMVALQCLDDDSNSPKRFIEKTPSSELDKTRDLYKSDGSVPVLNNGKSVESHNCKNTPGKDDEDSANVGHLFKYLQVLTAIFGSFAHGGNDVSNAIGPLIAIWTIYKEGSVAQTTETPIFILLYGGVGISIGLWVWGRRVIETVGENLTKVTPSSGFTIEIGSALTVLIASKIGIPISTTHCKVGSVVVVGWARSTTDAAVDWKLFRNIVIAWFVTVPLTAGLSALLMIIFKAALF